MSRLAFASGPQVRYLGNFNNVSELAPQRQQIMGDAEYLLGLKLRAANCAERGITSWRLRAQRPWQPFEVTVNREGCDEVTFVPVDQGLRAGVYDVEATRTIGGCPVVYRGTVEVFPKVVVGLGDSYGAGEGLPPYALGGCHRSEHSLQGEIVRRAFDAVPANQRRPVVFFHAACSAASSEQLFYPQLAPYGANGLPAMGSINPRPTVPPQLESLRDFLEMFGSPQRPLSPDALIVSVGGNDISFTGYVIKCATETARADNGNGTFRNVPICRASSPYPESLAASEQIASTATLAMTHQRHNYATLAGCLEHGRSGSVWVGSGDITAIDQHETQVTCPLSVPITSDRVVLTSYVEGLRGPDGFCQAINTLPANLEPEQSAWLSTHVMTPLERTLNAAANEHCWDLVSIFDRDVAEGRGVCAPQDHRWIFPIVNSLLMLRTGRMVHPNQLGAQAYGGANPQAVARRIAGTQTLATVTSTPTCECTPQPVPTFVGSPTPRAGSDVDWAALDAEATRFTNPGLLTFTRRIPYDPGNTCGAVEYELPTRCGEGYTDYIAWRMGGAVGVVLFPPGVPINFNNWVHNPGYFAEGMMDPLYEHPHKTVLVQCSGGGANFCGLGRYGLGTDDYAYIPSDLARTDRTPGPAQPGTRAYGGRIRAFPVYQRSAPDPTLPAGYQLCYDRIRLAAQGGGIPVACQANDGRNHGAIYITFQAACQPRP